MAINLWSTVLTSAQGAFIEVTVFVGVVLLFFGYIDYKNQGAFIKAITKAKKYQPVIGSLLGIIPGCGGSILVMPLYVRGTVTFGTVIATTIATTGDSAFVTLTQAPRDFAVIVPVCFAVGTIAGYIVDYYKIGDWVKKRSEKTTIADLEKKHEEAEALLDELYCAHPTGCRSRDLIHIGHEEGDEIDMALHHRVPLDTGRLGYKVTHGLYMVFWVTIALGFVLGVLKLMQVDINCIPGFPNAGIIIGGLGILITLLYMLCSDRIMHAQTHEDVEHKLFSLKETFIHNAKETAFVGTWVFLAYLAYELGVHFAGGEQIIVKVMTSSGLTSVLIGVLVGMIPGCGPQVLFVSLYLRGMFPFSALLANAISQDGDALFPLIAMDRTSAFWSTVINSIAAAAVGIAVYLIGF